MAVYFFSLADPQNEDGMFFLVDGIDDPVVSESIPVKSLKDALERFSQRDGVLWQVTF